MIRCPVPMVPMVLMALVLGMGGCLAAPGTLPVCVSGAPGGSICDLMNPEDLGRLPSEGWVLVSEMTHSDPNADEDAGPFVSGRLTAIRISDLARRTLYPLEWSEAQPAEPRWGDPSCEGPPTAQDFQPHGIDVGPGPGGETALAVVTHGEREVVDLFEIAESPSEVGGGGSEADAVGEPLLEWRGCVSMTAGMSANDVALLEGGGFVVTNFMPRFETIGFKTVWTLLKISMGFRTGSVLRWAPGGELVEIENSRGSAPNGIAASPDGGVVYVAEWGRDRVYRLRFREGLAGAAPPERDDVEVEGGPDNLTWTPDGRLLVAAQQAGPLDALGCGTIEEGGCDVGYALTSVDPESLVATPVLEGRGAASVALELDDEILVGVFSGDSIMRVPKPD